jgi:hypothetical protein
MRGRKEKIQKEKKRIAKQYNFVKSYLKKLIVNKIIFQILNLV